ncbi:unnamed protein product [Pipistrellus nathusii]|uniref:Uncharacterized protein n=1 Tax=Pipistrellus nathusii TaxID=59473 RepID=A0ABP0A9X9_PIPNA
MHPHAARPTHASEATLWRKSLAPATLSTWSPARPGPRSSGRSACPCRLCRFPQTNMRRHAERCAAAAGAGGRTAARTWAIPEEEAEAAAGEAKEASVVRGDQYPGEMSPVHSGGAGLMDLDGDLTCEMVLKMLNE